MPYGFTSPGANAGNAILQFLMQREQENQRRMLQEAEMQQAAQDAALRERQIAMQERTSAAGLERQAMLDQRAADTQQAGLRKEQNTIGVRGMMADAMTQGPLTPESAKTIGIMAFREGMDAPQEVQQMLEPEPEPTQFTLNEGDIRYDSTGRVIARGAPKKVTPPAPRDERLVQVMGPDGTPIWQRESQAVGQPATQAARAVTGQERKVLGFFQRMLEAERNARAVEEKLGAQDFAAEYAPGEWLENFFRTPEGQQYAQAQRTFTEGRLRKESGAAINKDEYDKDRTTNFKRPGDTPEAIKQKRAARLITLRGAGNEAGKALQEFYGADASLDALLKEFADGGDETDALLNELLGGR